MPTRRTPRPGKGSTVRRGYGAAHKRERRRLEPSVERGEAFCQQGLHGSSGTCLHRTRWIRPGTPWVLGHNDQRTAWIGPVHADCNQRDGASRGGQTIAVRKTGRATSRTVVTAWQSRAW